MTQENLPAIPDLPGALIPQSLPEVQAEDFLPAIGRWSRVGGWVLLGGFGLALILGAVLQYRVVVKASAVVRPEGELRQVQAASEGKVLQILARDNQWVRRGQVLARLDDSRLQTRERQLRSSIAQSELQQRQVQEQLADKERQIQLEQTALDRVVAATSAEVAVSQRSYRDRRQIALAESQEAAAAVDLAREELNRYRQLQNTGAISQLQLREKEAGLKVAIARRLKADTSLNPDRGEVVRTEQRRLQEQSSGLASMARLRQEQQQLLQTQADLQRRLQEDRENLRQVQVELGNTIVRAPVSGHLQQFQLRNPGQVVTAGTVLAQMLPDDARLVIKAQVPTEDISKLKLGQRVALRIGSCPYPDFGTLAGQVTAISSDALPSAREASASSSASPTAPSSYEVTIRPDTAQLRSQSQRCSLQAGMPGQADIITREETVLSFFLRKARLMSNL